ncbi:hypothetical protein EJ06DRAFT_507693 [Trichodelitschia bisporula]|uniref:Uncharacterized protein n=1 Tax=Trichodelitschia bisporula TaxID=703511 RepID=A0A6G1I078_9PEZI|nr:hypothetical protein EJ06DRAFT_507693 [Trichodelitschia bisporula]
MATPYHDLTEVDASPYAPSSTSSTPRASAFPSLLRRASLDFKDADTESLDLAPHPPSSRTGKRDRRILVLSLAGNALLFVLVLVVLASPCRWSGRECVYVRDMGKMAEEAMAKGEVKEMGLMGDISGFVPDFATERVTFLPDAAYAHEDMFSSRAEFDKVAATWRASMPLGRGFITHPNGTASGLPRPYHMVGGKGDGYSIAYLHQVHCVFMLLKHHGSLKFGVTEGGDAARHVTHCYDYLRQSALCAGDAALEGRSESVKGMTDGWGNVHVCRKREEERGWVLENRFSDKVGID